MLRNNEGSFGKTYAITLTGYIIVDLGFPLARDSRTGDLFPYYDRSASANAGPHLSFDTTQSHNFSESLEIDNRPDRQYIPYESAVDAMFFKQRVLRELFNRDGQRLEIIPIHTDESVVICYPRFVSINFEEGIYTDYCKYTVQLECDVLLNKNNDVDLDGILIGKDGNQIATEYITEQEMVAMSGRFIEAYTDTWSVDANDSFGQTSGNKIIAKTYTITRNISATGKDHYGEGDLNPTTGLKSAQKKKAWEQARDFVHFRLQNDPVTSGYPNFRGVIGSGIYNLVNAYQGFNHTRNESIDISEGNYSVTETWLLSSGTAYESYNSSVSISTDSPFINVNMRGDIKGLNTAPGSGDIFGGSFPVSPSSTYENALNKYYEVSNSGKFGVGCDIFKRANSLVGPELNAQPKSVSISYNQNVGEINYSLEFDNRPRNILSGVLMENISLTDTYPGDVFATIPVLGRKTGPILQSIGTRTEYKRDLTIDFIVDYTDIPYGSGRSSLLLQKPSLVEPIRSQLIDLINEFSPEREYGIRKWYINAPIENWTPKAGNYSLQLSWTYELNK